MFQHFIITRPAPGALSCKSHTPSGTKGSLQGQPEPLALPGCYFGTTRTKSHLFSIKLSKTTVSGFISMYPQKQNEELTTADLQMETGLKAVH